MSAKHTPGPWTAMLKPKASFSDHGWRAMAMCGSQWMVAVPASAAIKVENGLVVSAWDNEANARLVSAAPELLQALCFFVDHPGVGQLCTPDSSAMQAARAAVLKATGDAT